jgi:hypothetical protein
MYMNKGNKFIHNFDWKTTNRREPLRDLNVKMRITVCGVLD